MERERNALAALEKACNKRSAQEFRIEKMHHAQEEFASNSNEMMLLHSRLLATLGAELDGAVSRLHVRMQGADPGGELEKTRASIGTLAFMVLRYEAMLGFFRKPKRALELVQSVWETLLHNPKYIAPHVSNSTIRFNQRAMDEVLSIHFDALVGALMSHARGRMGNHAKMLFTAILQKILSALLLMGKKKESLTPGKDGFFMEALLDFCASRSAKVASPSPQNLAAILKQAAAHDAILGQFLGRACHAVTSYMKNYYSIVESRLTIRALPKTIEYMRRLSGEFEVLASRAEETRLEHSRWAASLRNASELYSALFGAAWAPQTKASPGIAFSDPIRPQGIPWKFRTALPTHETAPPAPKTAALGTFTPVFSTEWGEDLQRLGSMRRDFEKAAGRISRENHRMPWMVRKGVSYYRLKVRKSGRIIFTLDGDFARMQRAFAKSEHDGEYTRYYEHMLQSK